MDFLSLQRLRITSGTDFSDGNLKNMINRNTNDKTNDHIVKQIRKFEKLDYKIRKNEADLEFLTSCQHNQLAPKFLNFKVASSNLRYSKTYRQCQRQLLKQEIKDKTNIVCKQKKEFNNLKMSIKSKVLIIDFSHIYRVFFLWEMIKRSLMSSKSIAKS